MWTNRSIKLETMWKVIFRSFFAPSSGDTLSALFLFPRNILDTQTDMDTSNDGM